MSSVQTIFYGQVPYYSNLDQSRVSVEYVANQFSYSRQFNKDDTLKHHHQQEVKNDSADMSGRIAEDDKSTKPPKKFISLLPQALNRKIQSKRSEISIFFFNSQRRMIFQKEQLLKIYPKLNNDIQIRDFITYAVKNYSRLFLNFQPHEVYEDSFELKIANFDNVDDQLVEPISLDLPLNLLFQADNLVLTRKKRATQRIAKWRQVITVERPQLQIVEILMPSRKQHVEQMEKNKSINFLKEKVLSYNNQLGKIVMINYTSFKICQGKKKVTEFEEKVFQVYREKVENFVDKPQNKELNCPSSYQNVGYYENVLKINLQREECKNQSLEVFVNQTTLYGKLTISFSDTIIREKYKGGLVSYLLGEKRVTEYSIHSLVGLRDHRQSLFLKFVFKDRECLVHYQFSSLQKKQTALKNLLKIGRIYNKKWQKI